MDFCDFIVTSQPVEDLQIWCSWSVGQFPWKKSQCWSVSGFQFQVIWPLELRSALNGAVFGAPGRHGISRFFEGGLEVGNMGRLRLGLRHAGRRMVLSGLVTGMDMDG